MHYALDVHMQRTELGSSVEHNKSAQFLTSSRHNTAAARAGLKGVLPHLLGVIMIASATNRMELTQLAPHSYALRSRIMERAVLNAARGRGLLLSDSATWGAGASHPLQGWCTARSCSFQVRSMWTRSTSRKCVWIAWIV